MRKQTETILISLIVLLAVFANIQLNINPVFAEGSSQTLIASHVDYYAWRPLAELHPSDSAYYSAAFQCFKTPATTSFRITLVMFRLKKEGSPTGNAHAVLYVMSGTYGVDGLPTGSALATSDDFDVSTLTDSVVWYDFTFTGEQQYQMQADTYYCIAFENPTAGTIDGGNYVLFAYDDTVIHGLKIFGDYHDSDWDSYLNDKAAFYVYGTLILSITSVPSIVSFAINKTESLTVYSTSNDGYLTKNYADYATGQSAASADSVNVGDDQSFIGQSDVGGLGDEILIDNYTEANHDNALDFLWVFPSEESGASAGGQTFVVTQNTFITKATFELYKVGSPVGNLRAAIYNMSGTFGNDGVPTGDKLDDSANLDMDEPYSGWELYNFTFSGELEVTPGYYCVVAYVYEATTLNATNFIRVGADFSGGDDGNLVKYAGGEWATPYPVKDCCYYVYGKVMGVSYIYRSYFYFDTSNLPDETDIVSATLSLYGKTDESDADFYICIHHNDTHPEDPLVVADYNKIHYGTSCGGKLSTSGFTTSGYNIITFNSTGLAWINKTGNTTFCLRSLEDISVSEPAGDEYIEVWANEKGGNYRPKLIIVYADSETTPYSEAIASATYMIVFPATHTIGTLTWTFNRWEDDSTNRTRIIDLQTDMSLTAYYSSEYTPSDYTGYEPVFECAMNNMFELNGVLEGNDTYRQMLLDTSIYENHGKTSPLTHPYAGPELTWGMIGKGLEFDGVDDSVIIANSESLNITESITIEFWFMVYNATPNQKFISKTNDGQREWVIGIQNAKLYTELWTFSGSLYSDTESSETIEEGVFYYVGLTYDYRDGYYTVYLHGKPQFNVTTDANKIRNVNADMFLGSLSNSSWWFNGVLDEIRVFPYKRGLDEMFSDARTAIRRFDTWSFVNSGTSPDLYNEPDPDWTVVEGVSDDYQGFTNNDPELPWAYANGTCKHTLVRTLKYVAGFQQYQIYCNVSYDHGTSVVYGDNYVQWYWNFFKNGRLQSTYYVEVGTIWASTDAVTRWYVLFKRITPYFASENMTTFDIYPNSTLFGKNLPIIVSAWIGPDNKHFTVRVDVQDVRASGYDGDGDDPPFTYSYDLVDENLNSHVVDWFDGWIVAGIKVRCTSALANWAKMQIQSHKLAFLIPLIIIGAIIIGGIASYYLFPQVQETVNTVVKEVTNILQPVVEIVGSAVKVVGDTVGDALAGLAHDIIGGLSGLGTFIGQQLTGLTTALDGLAGSVWATLSSYAEPIMSALVNAWAIMGPALVGMLDTIFGWFGFENGYSIISGFITSLWAWLGTSITYSVSLLTNAFELMTSFIGKFVNTVAITVGNWVNMINTFWYILDNTWGGAQSVWDTIGGSIWITIIAILYPIYLLYLWDEQGLDALLSHLKMLIDIGAFICRIFITVIQLFVNILSNLIEKIPFAE